MSVSMIVYATGSPWFVDCYGDLIDRRDLTPAQIERAITAMIEGVFDPIEAAAFLTALRMKGESISEVATTTRVLRQHMRRLRSPAGPVIDTCGTGGDGSGTFNISTAVSIIVAAAGVAVVKHGNRSVSSRSGSADVLRELGVPIESGPEWAQKCLDSFGYAFCYAPQFHPGMAHIGAVRRQLAVRTVFNLVGPLANPAEAPYQLLGVGRFELLDTLAGALARFPLKRAALVSAVDGLDEISLGSTTRVRLIENGVIQSLEWTASDFGLSEHPLDAIRADSPITSARMITAILAGERGAPMDVVLANAAAALWLTDKVTTLPEGVEQAREAIFSGAARRLLDQLTRPEQ